MVALLLFWPITAYTPTLCFWPVYLQSFIIGFTSYPLFFVAYEVAVAQTKPLGGIGDAFSCSIINVLGNLFSVIQIAVLTVILLP